jgi:hypothetical protein
LGIDDGSYGHVVAMEENGVVLKQMSEHVNQDIYGIQLQNCDVELLPRGRIGKLYPLRTIASTKALFGCI